MRVWPSDCIDRSGKNYCARGVRAFFARHGLDYLSFVKKGIDADDLRATGDAMAQRAIEVAENRHG